MIPVTDFDNQLHYCSTKDFCKIIYFQKIETRLVDRVYIHICVGQLAEEATQQECVYFLRNTTGMVPLPNSMEEAAQE